MPIHIEFHEEPLHARLVLRGNCTHAEMLAAMHQLLPDPRTGEWIIWDLRGANLNLSAQEIRDELTLLAEYRSKRAWGTTVAVATESLNYAQCRMARTYADILGLKERIDVLDSLEKAIELIRMHPD